MLSMKCILLAILLNVSEIGYGMKIKITYAPEVEQWTIDYKLEEPTHEVVFKRDTNLFRAKKWTLKTPFLEFKVKNGKEIIVNKNAKSFSDFTITFKTYEEKLQKDYDLIIPYSNKDILLYTGHFDIVHQASDVFYEFVSLGKENIVAKGKVFHATKNEGRVVGRNDGNGFYVYFGRTLPLETDLGIFVIDKGLPSAVREKIEKFMPEKFDLLAKKLQKKLSFKPVLFISFDLNSDRTLDIGGGVVDQALQLHFGGKMFDSKVVAEQDELLTIINKTIVHEVSHLWNMPVNGISAEDQWIHEGSAEWMAFELIAQTSEQLKNFYKQEKEKCAQGLNDTSLFESAKNRKFSNFYSCGVMIYHSIDNYLKLNSKKSTFEFITTLIQAQEKKKSKFERSDFFRVMEEFAIEKKYIESLKNFVETKHKDNKQALDLL